MFVFCVLPLLSAGVRRHSRTLFLMGTGALFGICFFDLVPDVFALGGRLSLFLMTGVWLFYSAIHVFHLQHRHLPGEGEHEVGGQHGFVFFYGSLLTHCFASGMLLSVSQSLSNHLAQTVFIALLAHKTYESLLLTSVLIEQRRSLSWSLSLIFPYALSLPVGAWVTSWFQASLTQSIATVVSSIAVGTLLGCLIFDFLIPSLRQLRKQPLVFGWMLLGLILTLLGIRSQ